MLSPLGRASPHCAAFPPCARPSTFPLLPRPPTALLGAALRAATLAPRFARGIRDARAPSTRHRFRPPRSALLRSGLAAPASATAQPLARLGAACAGGWPSSPRRHAFGVHGWAPGGTRSLALARLRLGRCPRREDRRGSSRRSAALFRPAGFGWGRARLPQFFAFRCKAFANLSRPDTLPPIKRREFSPEERSHNMTKLLTGRVPNAMEAMRPSL